MDESSVDLDETQDTRHRDKDYSKPDKAKIERDDDDDSEAERKTRTTGLFGMKSWAIGVVDSRRVVFKNPEEKLDNTTVFTVGNVLWSILFGWWISLVLFISALFLTVTWFGRSYGSFCWELGKYMFFPFGTEKGGSFPDPERQESEANALVSRNTQPWDAPFLIWLVFFFLLVAPTLICASVISWFFVLSAPMAKVTWRLLGLCFTKPLKLKILANYNQVLGHEVILATYRAFSKKYVTYTLLGIGDRLTNTDPVGVNIFFVNCLPLVFIRTLSLVIGLSTGVPLLPPLVSFFYDLLCAIPITFFIGLSIECITLQTSYMVGALLNASFGSLTELILFTLALNKGNLSDLIIFSLTGGLLNDMLLIPGLSMVAGGFKYKEQRFNPSATGVGSLLFFIAIIGAFSPTIFYKAFGGYQEKCVNCTTVLVNFSKEVVCQQCYLTQIPDTDPVFLDGVVNLVYVSTALLPIIYFVGLFFTFRTHSHLFVEESGEEEDQPPWSIVTSVVIMSVSVLMFGLIAEDIVDIVEAVLHSLGVQQAFLGVTLIALTPAVTELANAIRFALVNQMGLSVQIGAASAVQVALIQMPCLTLIALLFQRPGESFHLIFPNLSIFAVTIAVFTFNYISQDGSANYFIGSVLVVMYMILIAAFYYVPGADH